MEEMTDGNKDRELRKLLKSIPLDGPSPNFTDKVLKGIHVEVLPRSTVYRPPISRGFFIAMALLICLVIVFSFLYKPDPDLALSRFVDQAMAPALSFLDNLADIGLSKTLTYGALALASAIFAQLYLLKRHLDRKVSVS